MARLRLGRLVPQDAVTVSETIATEQLDLARPTQLRLAVSGSDPAHVWFAPRGRERLTAAQLQARGQLVTQYLPGEFELPAGKWDLFHVRVASVTGGITMWITRVEENE